MTIDRFDDPNSCRVLVLTNPKAGSGASREQIPRLQTMLADAGINCQMVHDPQTLEASVTSDRSSEAVVVAAGGDGTLSLAVQFSSLRHPDRPISVVPMPLGTENLLACQFGHDSRAESVVQTIRYGDEYHLDVGIANGKPFLIMATCGFDAEVVRSMHLTRSGHISRFSYWRPILRALRRYKFPRLTVTIDEGEPHECCWAMVFNLPRYGGALMIEPDAIGNDGQLDVLTFERGSILSGLKYVSGIWLGRHLKFRDVVRRRGKRVEIRSEGRVPFQIDGDYAGHLPVQVTIEPASVRLLLPTKAPESD